ncbi:hypothetical protein Tco_1214163 [Tanacetum coccineum]
MNDLMIPRSTLGLEYIREVKGVRGDEKSVLKGDGFNLCLYKSWGREDMGVFYDDIMRSPGILLSDQYEDSIECGSKDLDRWIWDMEWKKIGVVMDDLVRKKNIIDDDCWGYSVLVGRRGGRCEGISSGGYVSMLDLMCEMGWRSTRRCGMFECSQKFVVGGLGEDDLECYTHALEWDKLRSFELWCIDIDQRHKYLRFEGLEYTDANIAYFEERLGKIYGRGVHRVHVFDFGGLTDLMVEGLSDRMLMEHMDAQGYSVFTSRAWRFGEAVLDLDTARALQFQLGGVRRHMSWREFILGVSSEGDFLGTAPSYTAIRDMMLRLCHRGIDVGPVNVPYLLARYLRIFASERKLWAMISGGQFVARLAEHFGLLTEQRLYGLTMIAWVAPGPERQPDAAAGALEVAEGAPDVDEGA